jgi:hypothetical protein
MGKLFKTKEECNEFVFKHMPLAIKPKRKAIAIFVSPFTSATAAGLVIEAMTEAIWEYQNEENDK